MADCSFSKLETDPIHRGKWIRKIISGTIPDVPITVDAVIPPDPHKTFVSEWRDEPGLLLAMPSKMDPLGFPLKAMMILVGLGPRKSGAS